MKSFAQSPLLRPVYNPYSVKLYVFVDGKIKEHLATIVGHPECNHIRINFKRLKYWLHIGLKYDKTVTFFIKRILKNTI
jgi:ribosomal protein S16